MGDRHDYVALEWVKGEIAETLKQARQALEAFVENPQDPTRMRFCLTYVHQVQGTLQMVEFYGAALLAEEMEQLVQALLDGRVPNQGEALEVLMQAILQLPVYLDRIQTARRDLPMVVLPLLNDLRAARGEKLLSETSLFAPDLSQRQPQLDGEAIAQLRTDELGGLLRKLRQTQQMALVGLLRNQDVATSLGYLARVYARLEGLCREAPLGPLWSIASGLVEGLANGSVVNSASVRTLLRQLDRELKRLVEQGADGLNQAAPDELVKNLLFYVAKAPSQSPRIRALKEQYRLDEALPDHETVDAERARLAGPDRDAMRSVVGALCEELVRIKDSLDLFVRSDRGHPSELDALLAPLKQIADTLAVLGFGQPRKVILDQLDVIHALAQGRREPSDAILMDVAGALLYVEATLAGMAGPGDERNSEESRLPTTDVAQIHQLVIKEARNGLEQAKDAIIEFIASQWNHEHLARVPELLTQVRGGLAMIPLERAATLLETCNRYIQEQLLARKAVPDWQSLDTLADAITSVEYYLERLSEDHASQSDLILDVAEDSLANLGYTLKPNSSAPAEPGLSGPAAIESPAAEPERPEAVVEVAETAEQPPADTAPAEAAREDAPQLASDDNWTLGEVAPDAGEPSLDLALDLPLDDSAEVPPALPEVVEESGQPQSTPAPARSLDDFSLDEIDLSGLDLPADAAPASGPADLADWSLPEQWGLGDDLAQPAQAGETLDLSLEEPALSFDAPLESLEPLPALEPFDGSAEQELVLDALDPLPLDVALPEAEGEVSAWEGSSLEELDLSDLDLPEVQLPEAEAEAPPAAEALASEAPALSLAEVMAAPVQPINPPAQNVPVSLLPPPADEEPVDEELREVFIEEAGEVLETIGRYLPAWKADHDDREALTEVRRAFHTLKGSGRMVRALVIGELAWSIENLFNRVLDRSIAASEPVQRVVDQVVALLPELVEEFAANAQRQRDDVDLLAATAHALAKGEPLPEPPAPDDGGVPPEAGAEQPSSLDNGVQAPPLADAPQAAAEAQSDVELLDPQLLEIFTNEAETHLEALVGFLADCARELPQPVTDALQRALHTLKGSAHMAGILPIAEIATPLEKLVKEYKSNLLAFDLREAELLHDAEQLFRIGLEQVGAQRPLNPIPGSDALLERIEALHQERIASLEAERYSDAGERRDPLLIEAFLVEGMDILLDAEDLLERWHEHPQERQELSALREELSTLDRGAGMPSCHRWKNSARPCWRSTMPSRKAAWRSARRSSGSPPGPRGADRDDGPGRRRPAGHAASGAGRGPAGAVGSARRRGRSVHRPESLGADDFPRKTKNRPSPGGLRRGRDACRGDRTGSACIGSRPRAGRGNGVDLPRRGGGHPRKRRPGTGPMAGRAGRAVFAQRPAARPAYPQGRRTDGRDRRDRRPGPRAGGPLRRTGRPPLPALPATGRIAASLSRPPGRTARPVERRPAPGRPARPYPVDPPVPPGPGGRGRDTGRGGKPCRGTRCTCRRGARRACCGGVRRARSRTGGDLPRGRLRYPRQRCRRVAALDRRRRQHHRTGSLAARPAYPQGRCADGRDRRDRRPRP